MRGAVAGVLRRSGTATPAGTDKDGGCRSRDGNHHREASDHRLVALARAALGRFPLAARLELEGILFAGVGFAAAAAEAEAAGVEAAMLPIFPSLKVAEIAGRFGRCSSDPRWSSGRAVAARTTNFGGN